MPETDPLEGFQKIDPLANFGKDIDPLAGFGKAKQKDPLKDFSTIETIEEFDDDPVQKKEQNIIFKTLEFINRPQYAISNAIHEAVVNDDYNLAKSLWDGLTLKDKRSVGDTLRSVIKPETKFGKLATATAGFVGDVLTDPLTYVGVGLISKGGKVVKGSTATKTLNALRKTGKAKNVKKAFTFAGKKVPGTEKLDNLFRAADKLGYKLADNTPVISPLINKLTAVSTKLRPRGVDPVKWEKYLVARNIAINAQRKIENKGFTLARKVAQAFKDEGLSGDDIAEIVAKVEQGSDVTSHGAKIAVEFRDALQKKYKDVGETGKKIIKEEGYTYLPHVLEGNKKVKKALGFGSKFTTKSPSDIGRTLVKFTDGSENYILNTKNGNLFKDGDVVDIFNKADIAKLKESAVTGKSTALGRLSQATIEEINDAIGGKVFSTDLPSLVKIQADRTAKVVGADEFFKRVRRAGTTKARQGLESVDAPELKGLFFEPELAKLIDAKYKKLTNVEEINDVIRTFDNIQNIWKRTATFWNVPFHTRNAISNVYQNTLAGVNNPIDYKKATTIQMKQRFAPESLDAVEKKILEEYAEQGLAKVGWMSGDIKQGIQDEIMTLFDHVKEVGKGKIKQLPKAIDKAGGNFGQAIEDNAKLAHFIAKRRKGESAFDAGQSVKKYLFDYQDLTDTERAFFKRAFPFWSWTRNNIPLQLETLIKQPARQTKLLKAKNNIEILTGDDKTEELIPEWLRESAPVFVGNKDGKSRYIKLEGFLPVGDLQSLSEPVKTMMNMLSPVLKTPLEQAVNRSFFLDAPITRQKGAKGLIGHGEKDFLWWRIPGRLENLARLFRPISEIEKVVGRRYEGTPFKQKILSTLLGAKLYEFNVEDLLERFDRITEEDARFIQTQINLLRNEGKREPGKLERNMQDIEMLREALIKSRIKSREAKAKAREAL